MIICFFYYFKRIFIYIVIWANKVIVFHEDNVG